MYNQTESAFVKLNIINDDKKCIHYDSKASSPKALLSYFNYDESSLYKFKLTDRKKVQVLDDINNFDEEFLNHQVLHSLVSIYFDLISFLN